jgi:antitoxin ParD1/3/4
MAEKLSITLPADMVSLIKERVRSGAYASTSEVLRAAMRTWIREEEEHEERMKAIRARVQASIDDPRPSLSIDEVRAHLEAFYADHPTAS